MEKEKAVWKKAAPLFGWSKQCELGIVAATMAEGDDLNIAISGGATNDTQADGVRLLAAAAYLHDAIRGYVMQIALKVITLGVTKEVKQMGLKDARELAEYIAGSVSKWGIEADEFISFVEQELGVSNGQKGADTR